MSNQANIDLPQMNDPADADPIFAALRTEQEAFQAFSDALADLARAGAFSLDLQSEEFIAYQRERLPELEAAEGKASAALIEAERVLLTTRPTTIQGAAALLGFLRKHLGEDPDIEPVINAIANIESVFGGSAMAAFAPSNSGHAQPPHDQSAARAW
jgi:hypothetical protein